jgi:hypothetical protein
MWSRYCESGLEIPEPGAFPRTHSHTFTMSRVDKVHVRGCNNCQRGFTKRRFWSGKHVKFALLGLKRWISWGLGAITVAVMGGLASGLGPSGGWLPSEILQHWKGRIEGWVPGTGEHFSFSCMLPCVRDQHLDSSIPMLETLTGQPATRWS